MTNIVGLLISAITMSVIPRGLGPKAYGDFSFLSNFFTQIVSFLDTGTSTAFYIKLSNRQKDIGLITFYIGFALIASISLFLSIFIISLTSLTTKIWPEQLMFFVYLAAIWGIFYWFVQILNKMVDAFGLTVPAELVGIAQKILGLILIISLFFTGQLTLKNFFYYYYVLLLVLGISFAWIIKKHIASLGALWKISKNQIFSYAKEFYQYSHPLFLLGIVGIVAGILDRWLLQIFGGSKQQGFYGLSYQIGAVCFIFTSAMTPLITREFSIAFSNKNLSHMACLFRRYIPLFYAIAAFFSCFLAVQADSVAYIFGGAKFLDASLAIAIMALYPIHQTYGQLSASVFLATGQTGLYRNMNVIFTIIGLPLTYFLIAPVDMLGVSAGSTGLAIKMVVIQVVAVNVQLYFNAKLLQLSFWKYFTHQILCLGCLLLLAFLSSFKITNCFSSFTNIIINFISNGMLYTITVVVLVYFVPSVFGLNRKDISVFLEFIQRFMLKA